MGGIDSTGAYVHTAQARHDANAMLKLCASRFVGGGYMLTGQGPNWLTAARPQLSAHGGPPLSQAHTVVVTCDGWSVTFQIRPQYGFGFLSVPLIDHAVQETLAAYDSWMVQHALMGPPSGAGEPYPVSQRSSVSVHVVEKQVVVVRCKYCQAHTPIDTPTCMNCGSAKFS